mgnify:FL=1
MNLYEVKIRNKTTGEWKSHGLFRNERAAHNQAFSVMQRLAIHNMSTIRHIKGSIRGKGKQQFDEFVKEIKNFEYTIETRIVR